MSNKHNLTQAQVAEIEALTSFQLKAIRRNIQICEPNDEQTREAVAQYVADGGRINDMYHQFRKRTCGCEWMGGMAWLCPDHAFVSSDPDYDNPLTAATMTEYEFLDYMERKEQQVIAE